MMEQSFTPFNVTFNLDVPFTYGEMAVNWLTTEPAFAFQFQKATVNILDRRLERLCDVRLSQRNQAAVREFNRDGALEIVGMRSKTVPDPKFYGFSRRRLWSNRRANLLEPFLCFQTTYRHDWHGNYIDDYMA